MASAPCLSGYVFDLSTVSDTEIEPGFAVVVIGHKINLNLYFIFLYGRIER